MKNFIKEYKKTNFRYKTKKEVYNEIYPFSKEKFDLAFENIILKKGKILLFDPFFMMFENLLENQYSVLEEMLKSNNSNITEVSWKHYIAIMGISTIRCDYLLSHYENEFLLSGGEISWLTDGLSAVPEKLALLADVNNVLAHQPWKLITKDINHFLENNWTKEELIEALIILTLFHRLSTVVESLKFNFFDSLIDTDKVSEIILSKSRKDSLNLNSKNSYQNLNLYNKNKEKTVELKNISNKDKQDWFDCMEKMNESDAESIDDNDSKFDKTSNLNSVFQCNNEVNSILNSNLKEGLGSNENFITSDDISSINDNFIIKNQSYENNSETFSLCDSDVNNNNNTSNIKNNKSNYLTLSNRSKL